MQPKNACSDDLPAGLAFSHDVTHAWVVQLFVLMHSMMSPHAALLVHAAP